MLHLFSSKSEIAARFCPLRLYLRQLVWTHRWGSKHARMSADLRHTALQTLILPETRSSSILHQSDKNEDSRDTMTQDRARRLVI